MSPNILLIDAAYIDRVAAAFRGHFGQELGRELPKADLAQWLVCLALDAELLDPEAAPAETKAHAAGEEAAGAIDEPGEVVQCILIHDRETKVMQHVTPGSFAQEIDGKAFTEPGLGEFALACCPVERVTTCEDLCVESLEAVLDDAKVRRVAVVYDFDGTTAESRALTKRVAKLCAKHAAAAVPASAPAPTESSSESTDSPAQPKDVTLFTMQPLEGGGFAQQLLGYSLLAALGVRSEELG